MQMIAILYLLLELRPSKAPGPNKIPNSHKELAHWFAPVFIILSLMQLIIRVAYIKIEKYPMWFHYLRKGTDLLLQMIILYPLVECAG